MIKQQSFRTRIRYLVLFTSFPLIICIIILLVIFINTNREYNNILTNLSIASDFNADFQKTLDFKMYQVVINREMFDEVKPLNDIAYAQIIVGRLQETTTNDDSLKHLSDIERYLTFLVDNINRIVENQGYDQNMQILDRRIRVLTLLVHQKMQEYIYNETQLMTQMHDNVNIDFTIIVIIFSVFIVIIIFAIIIFGLHMTDKLTKPLMTLSDNFRTVGEGDFSLHEINVTSNEIGVLHEAFGTMIAKIEDLMQQIAADKDNLRLIEFQLLQSQINPHFLYNAFDTIIWLTEDKEYDKVKKMMISLSNFCRIALSDGADIITLSEEIQHVRSYLEIQQIRYYDVLKYEIETSGELADYLIPKLSLQPIVENALYHGIKHKRGGGSIKIRCNATHDLLIISIRDTGIGMTEEKLEQVRNTTKSGYGLVNVFERLRLYYENDIKFDINSVYSEYTEVKFTIPRKKPMGIDGKGKNEK